MPRKRIKRVRFEDEQEQQKQQQDEQFESYIPKVFNSSTSSGHRAAQCWCATCNPISTRPNHYSIRIYVNIRYRGTSNQRLKLPEEIVLDVDPFLDIIDVWRAARTMNSRLIGLRCCKKLVSTNSNMTRFQTLPWNSQVVEVHNRRYRHWIFVVEKPSSYKSRRKRKCKKHKNSRSHYHSLTLCSVM